MERNEIEAFFEESQKVAKALGGLVHREAQPAIEALTMMCDIVGEELPGGYYGKCIGCEEVKGEDEMVPCGDESLCTDCVAKAEKKPNPEAE